MIRTAVLSCLACLATAGAAGAAHAQDRGVVLADADAARDACLRAREPGPRQLFSLDLDAGGFRLGRYLAGDGVLLLDTRRNLRAFGGSVELFPARMEPIGFVVDPDRASGIRTAAREGARLRVGFFLGFDDAERTLCLVRQGAGVTTVRMDVAYLELLGGDGGVIARDDTERLRAWRDDLAADAVAGEGPRGAIGAVTVAEGVAAVPASWQQALDRASAGATGAAIGRCHAQGVDRGASPEGQLWVRVAIDPRVGELREPEVELSTVGDGDEERCIARAVAAVRLGPSAEVRGPFVRLSIPVRLAD